MKVFMYILLFVMLVLSDTTILDWLENKFETPKPIPQIVSIFFNVIVWVSFSQFLQIL